jgi:predicted metal-dependent peptidase
MKLKRDLFTVLINAKNVDSSGEGKPSTGVEPFEPDESNSKDSKGDSKEDKGDSKGDGKGEGKGEGKDNKDRADAKGEGKISGKIEKVSGKGIGATLTPEESAKLQEELGVPVELPTADDAEKIKEDAKRAIQKTSSDGPKSAGSGKGLLRRAIAKLTQPQIDWKSALRKFIGKAMSTAEMYMGSRRHLHGGDYLFGEKYKFDALQNAVVAVDTSGSMGPEDIQMILSEISGIIKAKKVKTTEVVYFDGDVQSVDTISNTNVIFDLDKVQGGGGTNFKPPLRYMEDKFKKGKLDLAVFCTDGFNSDNPLPIPKFKNIFVWVIMDNPEFKPPFGTLTCYVSKNDLKKK